MDFLPVLSVILTSVSVGLLALVLLRKPAAPVVDLSTLDLSGLERLAGQITAQAEAQSRAEAALRDEFKVNREELAKSVATLADTIRGFGAEQQKASEGVRQNLDAKLKELREENAKKLDEMRKTVDEHLQTALEKKLTESFKNVSSQLESVHKGLGEMQVLATGVGDLKRVLTNVKARGTFGEGQLETLIADMLTADQYVANYDCGRKDSRDRVEFGIRMPGQESDVYLPVDAKFPIEDYERLLTAIDSGDRAGVDAASNALEARVKSFAKDVASKYINPPHTTDWAMLFLPTEGLYAELLRRPGLFEALQRDYRITLAGPTNVQVLLSTVRMGFRQMAINERANDVWQVLGAVKKEFGAYAGQLDAMTKSLNAAQNHVEKLGTRQRAMIRALKTVEEGDSLITADISDLSAPESASGTSVSGDGRLL